jgi:NAD+ synthase (glutamine-hydrolysing)
VPGVREVDKVRVRLALCQVNPTVGSLGKNLDLLLAALKEAEAARADIALMPELAVCGYPPEDLVLKPRFVADCVEAAHELASSTSRTCAIFGFPEQADPKQGRMALGGELAAASAQAAAPCAFDSVAVAAGGDLLGTYRKTTLANYGVFDEKRLFLPGDGIPLVATIAGANFGLAICEDAWGPSEVIERAARAGADAILVANASPFYRGRLAERLRAMGEKAQRHSLPLAYVNLVGGQDELVFDGGSFVVGTDGAPLFVAPQFEEGVFVVDLEIEQPPERHLKREDCRPVSVSIRGYGANGDQSLSHPVLEERAQLYSALTLATRDYVEKNGFPGALVATSGGIDSSLVLCIACDALGPERVTAISMPSSYTSEASQEDARELAGRLGVRLLTIPITGLHRSFREQLSKAGGLDVKGTVDENLQARIRGVLLMSVSNATGYLVLATSNKSEAAVGYSTLYGDTAGGFAVIKDLYKTEVYELARYRNELSAVIPERVFTRPPSAELRPGQTDQDTLPPYQVLDQILRLYIEGNLTAPEICERGAFDEGMVYAVTGMVDASEYKRRQSPPGIRVSPRSFGKDRRMPVTNGYLPRPHVGPTSKT